MAPTPVMVGVGDFVNRSRLVEDAVEPLELILNAIKEAIHDTCLRESAVQELLLAIDSLDVVRTWTWPYPDLPGLIAHRLGIAPKRKHYTEHGGNQPALVFDEASRRISRGESKVAIVTGGEALASLASCAAKKQLPPPGWAPITESVNEVFSPTTRELKPDLGSKHSIGNPIHIYPLYENGFRAFRGQSVPSNNHESALLYEQFAKVAEANKYAWNHGTKAETARSIGTPSAKNRMICHPYPLLMNAFNNINLAAACIITSTDFARELGVPEERWIYPLGGAGTQDSSDFWHRPDFHSSPSISQSLTAALEVSNLSKDDIDLFDFYSDVSLYCFPIVPKLACHHLSLPTINPPKPITLLGGLTSFGGAGNNYSMHALTEMTRQLRKKKGETGLVLANGGVLTYQHVVCLSSSPRKDGSQYPSRNPLPDRLSNPAPAIQAEAKGAAVIETYTVEFARDGAPKRGHIVGRLASNNHRFLANHADENTLLALSSMTEEQIGKKGKVWTVEAGRNLFALEGEGAKL